MGWSLSNFAKNPAGAGFVGGADDIIGASGFGEFIPGIGDAMAAEKQNKANIAAADKAMAFSERMSSSAYQRAMADMRKAGLNPMLAYIQGGASAPTGVTPTINSESKSGLGQAAISTALGIKGLQTQQQQADTAKASAESSIALNQSTAAKQVQDISESQARVRKTDAETKKIRKTEHRDEAQNRLEKKGIDLVDNLLSKLGTSAKSSASSMKEARDLIKSPDSQREKLKPTGNRFYDWLSNRK